MILKELSQFSRKHAHFRFAKWLTICISGKILWLYSWTNAHYKLWNQIRRPLINPWWLFFHQRVSSSKCKQNRESTEGYSKSIVRKNNDKFGKVLVSTSRTHASPKGTGPGVRRSKCPLLACHTRRRWSMEINISWNVMFSNVKSGNNATNW